MAHKEIGILLKMRTMYDALAKSEKRVVSYILEKPEEVIRLSVTDLADNSGVSDATVVRTCRKLGMSGYQEMKVFLAQSLVSPIQSIHEDISDQDAPAQVIQKIFNAAIHTLNYTLSVIDYNKVHSAAQLLAEARRIVIVAVGNSGSLGMDLHHKLLQLGLDAIFTSDAHMQMTLACCARPEDVMVAISHSGSSRDIVDVSKEWKEGGGRLITLTNIGRSPLSKQADISLSTASQGANFRQTALSSRVAAMTLIDSLYTLLAMNNLTEIDDLFRRMDICMVKRKY